MICIVRTSTLREMASQTVEMHDRAEELAAELAEMRQVEQHTADFLIRAELAVEQLRKDLRIAQDDAAHARGELDVLRAQHLLDTEDRVVLRALLRTARRQQDRADRVHVLFHHGRLHSVHATHDAAEIVAETEGAPRSGWTAPEPGAALPPASEVTWRIQALPLGGAR